MYESLGRMESGYQRQQARRAAAERRADRHAGVRGAGGGGRYALVPGGYNTVIAGGAVAGGVTMAFKKRMEADLAEVKANIFGELSRDDIKAERKGWIDKSSIKFGVSASKVIDSFTESLKAGFGKDAARQITQGALEAQSALELDISQLIKLGGKVASAFGGDIKNIDPRRVIGMMNAIAVAAAETAADPDEVIEAFKKGNAALSMSKLNEQDLAALTSVAISTGIQPGKAGNAVSNLISTLVGGNSARGQKAKDLDEAARVLGYGGRRNMSKLAADNPMDFLIEMFGRMKALDAQKKTHIARLLGGQEWDDEIVQIGNAVEQIITTRKAVQDKTGKIGEASKLKTSSLQGRWNSIVAGFTLMAEKIGSGFEDIFTAASDYFLDASGLFNFNRFSENTRSFVNGIKRGFGYDNWSQMFADIFGGKSAGDAKKWGAVGQGLAEGLRTVWSAVKDTFVGIAAIAGVNTADPKAMAKFAAELFGFTVVLRFLAPVVGVLAAAGAFLWRLGKWVEWMASFVPSFGPAKEAAKKAAPRLLGRIVPWAELLYGDGRPDNKPEDLGALLEEYKKARKEKESKGSSGATDFSGRRRTSAVIDELNEQLKKFGGNVQRAAFMSSGLGGVQYAAIGGGSGGGLGGSGAGLGDRRFIGDVPGLLKSVPGQKLPSFGIGPNGIIRRENIPSFSGGSGSIASGGSGLGGGIVHPKNIPSFNGGGGSAADNAGTGLSGNAFLAARRARFKQELDANPELKKQLAAVIDLENPGAGTAVAESLMNRMDMNGGSVQSALGLHNRGKSFYGPVRRGLDIARLRELERNPARMAARMRNIDEALAGSNLIKGHTDQGSAGDPNYVAGGTGVNINRERFNDWGGGRWGGRTGHAASRAYRENLMRHIQEGTSSPIASQVPSTAESIQNVPALRPNGDASLGSMGSRGNIAIHINGNSHDPEALATLVQRRIDESMNWRTHDTEF